MFRSAFAGCLITMLLLPGLAAADGEPPLVADEKALWQTDDVLCVLASVAGAFGGAGSEKAQTCTCLEALHECRDWCGGWPNVYQFSCNTEDPCDQSGCICCTDVGCGDYCQSHPWLCT